MSYSLVIEGTNGARRIRRGALPRRGEWLSLKLGRTWLWLPVMEVGYSLSEETALDSAEKGCDFAHEKAESLVFTSLALAIRAEPRVPEEAVKLILPPTRWPLGGRVEDESNSDGRNGPIARGNSPGA